MRDLLEEKLDMMDMKQLYLDEEEKEEIENGILIIKD
jgi:hypothetical protein